MKIRPISSWIAEGYVLNALLYQTFWHMSALCSIHLFNVVYDDTSVSKYLKDKLLVRSTPLSRPNNIKGGLKCPSVGTSVRTYVLPSIHKKVCPISMKCGV